MNEHVLIIEDDVTFADLLRLHLVRSGYEATVAATGQEGLRLLQAQPFDLLLLDIMLPGVNGWEICQQVRAESDLPILVVTALGEMQHKLRGFELGADDYLIKPFDAKELLARVRALLKRYQHPTKRAVVFRELQIDPIARTATVDGKAVNLTPKEFDLLYLLASAPGRTFRQAELLRCVWHLAPDEDVGTVRVHIGRLRHKLGAAGRYLKTVWGCGYKFEA